MDAIVGDVRAYGGETQVARFQGFGLIFENGPEVFDEFAEVEDAANRSGVVSGRQGEVVKGDVAEDEIAAEEVEGCCALVSLVLSCLEEKGRWEHTISRVITDGFGRVALAMRLVPSDSAGRRSFGLEMEKPAKELRAVLVSICV